MTFKIAKGLLNRSGRALNLNSPEDNLEDTPKSQ